MPSRFCLRPIIYALALSLLLACGASSARAQGERDDFGDDAADPVKLFERGQDAHERGDLKLALEFYEEAIKLRPEFPEAEYQRGTALVALNRMADAEQAFRRAAELNPKWALPRVGLATLLIRVGREQEAEPLLRRAIELDAKNSVAYIELATRRLRAGATREAVELMRRATALEGASAHAWAIRGMAERAAGDKSAAASSLDRALAIDPREPLALVERAELRAEAGDYPRAIEDMQAALRVSDSSARIRLTLRLARFLVRAGRREEALRILDGLGPVPPEFKDEADAVHLEIASTGENTPEVRAALEEIFKRDPRNASIAARLGELYRTIDPARSLDYYRRAVEIDPSNADYATGYAAALVQARRFAEAATILKQVIAVAPDNYAAHANLATALDELKRYTEALVEYGWISRARPDLAITYFFIARAHDLLGEYEEALGAYETFLARARAEQNPLEIEKVNLRLPSLRKQIERGESSKRRKQSR